MWSCIFSLFVTLVFKKVACPCLEAVTPQALSAAQPRPSAHDLCYRLMLSSKELVATRRRGELRSVAHVSGLVRNGCWLVQSKLAQETLSQVL